MNFKYLKSLKFSISKYYACKSYEQPAPKPLPKLQLFLFGKRSCTIRKIVLESSLEATKETFFGVCPNSNFSSLRIALARFYLD